MVTSSGVTVIDEVVAPVFHLYVDAPSAAMIIELPLQTVVDAVMILR